MDIKTEERSVRSMQLKKTFDTDKFYVYIDSRIDNGHPLMEVVIDYCDRNNIDIQIVADIIKRNAKYKKIMLEEASQLRMIKTKE